MVERKQLELKRIFHAISIGYSSAKIGSQIVYIKHFTLSDQVDLDSNYEQVYEESKSKGLPTENEVVEQLKRQGFWKQSDEEEIKAIMLYIDRLRQTKTKQTIPSQVEQTQRLIEVELSKLDKKNKQKSSQIGNTCEKLAANRLNGYFIFKSFYKDKGLTIPLYSEEEFDLLEDEALDDLIKIYNSAINNINTNNIKLICLQSFFQNYFYLTENLSDFWGKPIIQLTSFQSEISAYGRYFKQLLSNTKDIPDEVRNDPEKLIDFVNSSSNMKEETKEKGENALSIMGATKEDLKAAGLETGNPLALQARKKKEAGLGGLTSSEIQQIQEGQTLYK